MVNKKNILVTGGTGQLGVCLKHTSTNPNYNFYFKGKKDVDISNFLQLKNFLKKKYIQIIINCAAYTDVEGAEVNRKTSDLVNCKSIDNVARLCHQLKIKLIHISTDFVFEGTKKNPYVEDDETKPVNYYGFTKLEGEKIILKYNLSNSLIIRTSWLYSKSNDNFVSKILFKINNQSKIYIVEDEIGSPTNAYDLSKVIMKIIPNIKNSKTKIYHFSNLGFCSRFEFANKIKEIVGSQCKIIPIKKNYSIVKRPRFSALNSKKISDDFQISIKTWQDSLKDFFKKNNINHSHEI